MKYFLLALLLLVNTILLAQEELEENYIPPAKSVFSINSEEEEEFKKERSYPDYSIKIIPTTLIRNIISLEFEKSLSETISLGLVTGYCLGKSYIQTETINYRDLSYDSDIVRIDEMLNNSDPSGGGLVFGAYIRLYIESYSNESDKFWELHYRQWSYAYDFDYFDSVQGNSIGRLKNNFIGLLWGFQLFAGKKDTFILDSKLGFGLNLGHFDSFSIEEDFNTGGYIYTKSNKERFMVPMIYYSIALGYAKYSK